MARTTFSLSFWSDWRNHPEMIEWKRKSAVSICCKRLRERCQNRQQINGVLAAGGDNPPQSKVKPSRRRRRARVGATVRRGFRIRRSRFSDVAGARRFCPQIGSRDAPPPPAWWISDSEGQGAGTEGVLWTEDQGHRREGAERFGMARSSPTRRCRPCPSHHPAGVVMEAPSGCAAFLPGRGEWSGRAASARGPPRTPRRADWLAAL